MAEVEIALIPGIPYMHFLGLPDKLIKESFYRIKSAFKSTGYKFPTGSQIIVNIKPHHLRKSSRGVELAIALGLLRKTGQLKGHELKPDWVIYGELGLDGQVYQPSDLSSHAPSLHRHILLTGASDEQTTLQIPAYRIKKIGEAPQWSSGTVKYLRPPEGLERRYSPVEAEFLFLSATSGLHSFLAGDSGAGKSTLAFSLASFLAEPTADEDIHIAQSWRPVVAPHSSLSGAAFIGGGRQLFAGEVERAQGGVLLLDELLEFSSEVLESLRGPMVGADIRISRHAGSRQFRASLQVVATTNLCPCGKWNPEKKIINCRFSRTRCRRYLERLSGPLLDRFGIAMLAQKPQARTVSGQDILKRVERCRAGLSQIGAAGFIWPDTAKRYYAREGERRLSYLEKVSFIYALERLMAAQGTSDLGVLQTIPLKIEDFNKAEQWVIKPFALIERGMG